MYRVFIVDDEPLICKGLRETIEWDSLGLEISGEAHNGAEAMSMIATMHPHILITDIRMPGMDGIALIKSIRENDMAIRILILSGYSDFVFLKEAIRLGVDGYLLKPIDPDELISNLRNLVTVIEEEMMKSSRIYQGMELLRTNTLNRLITNEIGRNEFEEKAELLDLQLEAETYLCAVCILAGDTGETDDGVDPATILALQEDYRKRPDHGGYAFIDPKNRLVLLLFGRDEAEISRYTKEATDYLFHRSQERWGKTLHCFMGRSVHTREEIHTSYDDALRKLAPEKALTEEVSLEGRWKSAVDRTIDYIGAHYDEPISLKQIAGLCDINTSYLGQVFRKTTNESFTNYVNRYRIEKAKELLAQTTLKVYEISEKVGFTDYHYFLKIFKKITGFVPTDTRCDNFYHKN